MPKFRHVLAAMVATAGLVPASAVHASSDVGNDVTAEVTALVRTAVDLVAEEQSLLTAVDPAVGTSARQNDSTARLQWVDLQGLSVLNRLEDLDVELTDAIRTALAPIPRRGPDDAPATGQQQPPATLYDTAIADLLRIAAAPDAMLPSARDTSTARGGAAIGLLVVAAMSLLALVGAALISNTRRRPVSDELAAMAWSDGLTGLANRRRLDHDLLMHRRYRASTAVIMVDVDHFKSVNDRFGHKTGDEVLREIGAMLAAQIRFDDIVYRYGGEEFCVLLPNSSAAAAGLVADRIVAAAREIKLPDGQHITVSVGIADSIEGDVGTAVETADQALYTAKDRGRDRAVTADPGQLTSA